jgi:hypothetical protein
MRVDTRRADARVTIAADVFFLVVSVEALAIVEVIL